MASHARALLHGRRLSEFLDEQQEPFLLEAYLLENGCSCRVIKSRTATKCWTRDACWKVLGFNGDGLRRRRGVCRVGCVLQKLVHSKLFTQALNWDRRGAKRVFDCFHGKTGISWFEHLSHSREEDEMQSRRKQETKQLSPVSVFELHSDEGCSAQNLSLEEENPSTSSLDSEPPLFTASFCNLHQHTESSKAMFQPKQLLFRCVTGVRILDRRESLGQGKVLSMEKQNSDETGNAQLVDGDLSGSAKEWNHFQHETKAIGTEIEGFIFEDMRDEAVAEMLGIITLWRKMDSTVRCVV